MKFPKNKSYGEFELNFLDITREKPKTKRPCHGVLITFGLRKREHEVMKFSNVYDRIYFFARCLSSIKRPSGGQLNEKNRIFGILLASVKNFQD